MTRECRENWRIFRGSRALDDDVGWCIADWGCGGG